MSAKPFTASTLAARWECSEGLIYKLIAQGRLRSFRIGTLIRISQEEVERFECGPSSDLEEALPKFGETVTENDTAEPWTPEIGKGRKRRRVGFGQQDNVASGPWAA